MTLSINPSPTIKQSIETIWNEKYQNRQPVPGIKKFYITLRFYSPRETTYLEEKRVERNLHPFTTLWLLEKWLPMSVY